MVSRTFEGPPREEIDQAVFTLNRELRYTAFNRVHAANMKEAYGTEIVLGGRIVDYQSVAVDRETMQADLKRALAGERRVFGVCRGKPGHELKFGVVYEPLLDAKAAIVGVTGYGCDLTAQQATKDNLSASEEWYRDLFNNAIEGIYQASLGGKILAANEAFAAMLGYSSATEVLGKTADSAHQVWVDPDERRRFGEVLLDLGTVRDYECRFFRRDGSSVWVSVSSHLVLGPDGEGLRYEGFVEDITERKLAEAALRESEAARDVTERVARVGSWRVDVVTNQVRWSKGMFALFDIDPGELDADETSILTTRIRTDDQDSVLLARATALETGELSAVEFRVVHRDGSEHILFGEVATERDETGKAVALTGYYQDVTDEREAASRLEAVVAEWRETFDAMGSSVVIFDRDGLIVRCNTATSRLTGRDFEDIIGHRCDDVFHDDGGSDYPREPSFRTGAVETSVVRHGGRWLRLTFTSRPDDAGQVSGGIGVVTDITQLLEGKQAAVERTHFLEELLEAVPLPMFFLDASLHYVGCNNAYAASFGRSKEDVIGMTVFEVTSAEYAQRFDASDRDLLAHPDLPAEEQFEWPGPDGSPLQTLTHKAVFTDVAGKPAGIVGVNLDVTEIRRAEQELASSAERLALTLEGAVTALGATTELRDPYTAGHQRRVAEFACAIARELGWNEQSVASLRIAAVLHDIGKTVVPAEILSKPGRLSEIEMQPIRQHAAAGAEIVGSIGFERNVAEIIHQHHERLDGSGYPDGLRDGEILMGARILAVADVVEAMVSHRPYRPALPIEVALAELKNGCGTLYDAESCEIATKLIRERRFTFTK